MAALPSNHEPAVTPFGDGAGAPWQPQLLAHARHLHEELLALHQQIDTTFLEVGVRLKEIRDRGLYQPLEAPSFNAYLETLEFSRSRAYALIGVVEDFYLSSRLDKAELLKVGWEKLSLLRQVKELVTFSAWLERGKTLGKRQLRQALVEAGLVEGGQMLEEPEEPEQESASRDVPLPAAEPFVEAPVFYLAIKKLSAVKRMSAEEAKAAKHSGVYPMIVAATGSVYAQQTNLLGLPHVPLKEALPVLEPDDDADGQAG